MLWAYGVAAWTSGCDVALGIGCALPVWIYTGLKWLCVT